MTQETMTGTLRQRLDWRAGVLVDRAERAEAMARRLRSAAEMLAGPNRGFVTPEITAALEFASSAIGELAALQDDAETPEAGDSLIRLVQELRRTELGNASIDEVGDRPCADLLALAQRVPEGKVARQVYGDDALPEPAEAST